MVLKEKAVVIQFWVVACFFEPLLGSLHRLGCILGGWISGGHWEAVSLSQGRWLWVICSRWQQPGFRA